MSILGLVIVGVILLLVGALAPTPYPWGRVLTIAGIVCLVVALILFLMGYVFVSHDPTVAPAAMSPILTMWKV